MVKFYILVLVHNKADLEDSRQLIKKSEGEEKAKKLKVAFHVTSVMRDQGVNEVFKRLARANLEKILATKNGGAGRKEISDTGKWVTSNDIL